MDEGFLTACFPRSVRVCGEKLTVFSPYHFLMLRAINSPFMQENGRITPADLLVAIRVCTHRFGGEIRLKPRLRDVWHRWRLTQNVAYFRRSCETIAAFIGDHMAGPRFWETVHGGQKTRQLTAPDIMISICDLMMRGRIPEADAWNMSFARAKWISATMAELEGAERRFLYEDELKDPD
jgi:hypothetical protein